MPARKPRDLHNRHDTKADRQARADHESSVDPGGGLPMSAPARLVGHPVAEAAWRRLMRLYSEMEAAIVTRLDMDLLIDYCVLLEQISEIDKMRSVAYAVWLTLAGAHEELLKRKERDAAAEMAVKVTGAFDAVIKLDGRADRKRALALQLRQSLYLTPRARAGVAPAKKEEPEPPDELEQLLNEANGIVHGGQ